MFDSNDKLPNSYDEFKKLHSEVWAAYDKLGAAVHSAGPLDSKTRELVKLGLAIGARLEGAVHAHTRLALQAGASPLEIRHVVLLATTTIGFPSMMAARSWVQDTLTSVM